MQNQLRGHAVVTPGKPGENMKRTMEVAYGKLWEGEGGEERKRGEEVG
jgi:hypothetical protein